MTVNSRVVRSFIACNPEVVDIPLKEGLCIQILPSVADLPKARKYQFAAYLAAEDLLLVWDDDAANLIKRAKAIESELMDLVWMSNQEAEEEEMNEKPNRHTVFELDAESGEAIPEHRSTNLMNSILVAWTLIIVITLLGLAARSLAVEISVDHGYIRLAFLALVPVQIFFTLVCTHVFFRPQLIFPVFRTGHRRLCRSVRWSRTTDAAQLQILLCHMFATTPSRWSSSYHYPMSRVQRRPCRSHRPYSQVNQTSHFDLRTSRRVGKYARQRRRSSDY